MANKHQGGIMMSKIQEFNELHSTTELLFIGNAWDLLPALTLESTGFKAIGTTSWGIANSLGYAGGLWRKERLLQHEKLNSKGIR